MAGGSSVLNAIENRLDVHGTLIHLPKVCRALPVHDKYIKNISLPIDIVLFINS